MGDQLIVAGFHRSGTSLVGQLLHRAGLFMGNEMLGAHRTNPHGHFEDREIVSLHDEILADNGLSWQVSDPPFPAVEEAHLQLMQELIDRREGENEVWGFKDPRVCLFMDQWKELVPEAKVLIVYRDFAEATRSLHQRHAGSLARGVGRKDYHRRFWEERDLALKMWLVHNKALLDFARAYPEDVLAVSFDMLRQGFPLIRTLNRQWQLGLEQIDTSEVFDQGVTGEGGSRQPVSDRSLVQETLETWEALEQLSRQTEELAEAPAGRRLRTEDAFYGPEDLYYSLMQNEYLSRESEFLQEQVDHFLAELEAVKKERNEIRSRLQEVQKLVVHPHRRRELERSEQDLRLIVQRISRSWLAPLFRLKQEFRALEQRYGK